MAMPRVLGFVFNPISIYFIEDMKGEIRAILYEVNNTFGNRHTYIIKTKENIHAVSYTHLDVYKRQD